MKKIILYSAVSIDGFIAKTDGDIEWLHDPNLTIEGEDFGYSKLMNTIDTTLMGASTYRQILGFDMPFPYIDSKNYVFSRDKKLKSIYAEVIHDDIIGFVNSLKSGTGKNIWLIGGGQINGLLLNHGLIDELILSVIPIIIGDGIHLFEGVTEMNRMQLNRCLPYKNGMIQLEYTSSKSYFPC